MSENESEERAVDGHGQDAERRVPWHVMETWGVRVGDERVEVSPDVTVREIRARLPERLRAAFDEDVVTTPLRYLGVMLSAWALPVDKLRAYRRHQAETYCRGVAVDPHHVVVPADLDVDEVVRTRGDCLLGTDERFLPRGAFSATRGDET